MWISENLSCGDLLLKVICWSWCLCKKRYTKFIYIWWWSSFTLMPNLVFIPIPVNKRPVSFETSMNIIPLFRSAGTFSGSVWHLFILGGPIQPPSLQSSNLVGGSDSLIWAKIKKCECEKVGKCASASVSIYSTSASCSFWILFFFKRRASAKAG